MRRARLVALAACFCAAGPLLAPAQVPMPPPKPAPEAAGDAGGFVWADGAPADAAAGTEPEVASPAAIPDAADPQGPADAAAAAGTAEEQPAGGLPDGAAAEIGAAQPDWHVEPVTAESAAQLFEMVCLGTLPDFAAAGALFDGLGFVGRPGMRIRNHPQKNMSALAMHPEDIDATGIRSCAVLVDGIDQSPAVRAVEPIVRARFGPTRRYQVPESGLEHVTWMVETPSGATRIAVTETAGAVFIGATVVPRAGGAQQ